MDNVAEPRATSDTQGRPRRTENLMPIGRFSKMTRLSVKALRLYDELGLLAPAWVDPASSYRYYTLAQANRAEAIRVLRRVNMPLDDIAAVLAEDDQALVAKRLGMHRERLAERLAQQERTLRFLERLIERGEGVMPYDVTIKEIAEQTVAALRTHTTLRTIGATLAEGFGRLVHQVGAAGGTMTGAPFVVYHTIIDEQTDGEIEICVPATDVAGDGEVERVVMPAHTVASTVHRGPYEEVGPAYHTLSGWIQDNGHQIAGPPREIYRNDPQEVPPEEVLTEVQWPIERGDT
jgi:effector-binding domain-containing protein